MPQPASSTFENLFPFTSTGTIFPNPVTNTPSNNGLAKVDYSPTQKNHFDGFVYISRESTTTGGVYQPYWGSVGLGSTSEYAGAWTYTPNSSWVNDLRGGAAPNLGSALPGDSTRTPGNAYPGGYSVNTWCHDSRAWLGVPDDQWRHKPHRHGGLWEDRFARTAVPARLHR